MDKITSEETTAAVTDTDDIAEYKVGFNNTPESDFVSLPLDSDGNLRAIKLEEIYGGKLTIGTHTLKLQAYDAMGNKVSTQEYKLHIQELY